MPRVGVHAAAAWFALVGVLLRRSGHKAAIENHRFPGGVNSLGENRQRGSVLEHLLAKPKFAESEQLTGRICLSAD